MTGVCMHINGVVCDSCRNQYLPPVQPYVIYYPPQPRILDGQKCDVCGSTAIDHTENHCSVNRMLKPAQSKPIKEEE